MNFYYNNTNNKKIILICILVMITLIRFNNIYRYIVNREKLGMRRTIIGSDYIFDGTDIKF